MSIAEELQAALGAAGQGFERQMSRPGLTLATVTNINDDQKLNRVKCIPIENENAEETDWCYVMAPLGGKSCGQFFFPNVGDLVVLGYLGGDPHRPLVLGAWWNTERRPPYTVQDGKVHNFSIKTPGGTELLFYDEPKKERAVLTLPSGAVLTVDDGAQSAALQDKDGKNALTMDFKGGNITLKAGTKLTLSAGDTSVVLESSGDLTQKASNRITVQGAQIEEKGSASVKIEGGTAEVKASSTLTLQASGPAALKGAVVNIN